MSSVLARSTWPAAATPGTTRTVAFSLPSGTARRLVVISASVRTTDDLTFNGVSCTAVGSNVSLLGINHRGFIYDVPDALPSGSYDLVFTLPSGSNGHTYKAWCFNGATGSATPFSGSNGAGSASASIATNAGDLLFVFGSMHPVGTTFTSLSSAEVTNAASDGAGSSATGWRTSTADAVADATETVTYTLVPNPGTNASAVYGVMVADSGGAPETTRRPTFLRAVRRLAQRYLPSRVWTGAVKVAGAPEPPAPGIPLDAADSRRRRRGWTPKA